MGTGNSYSFTAAARAEISGVVTGGNGQPAARSVAAYMREDERVQVDTVTSDATTGAYSLSVPPGFYTVVCLPADGENLNAIVVDNVQAVL